MKAMHPLIVCLVLKDSGDLILKHGACHGAVEGATIGLKAVVQRDLNGAWWPSGPATRESGFLLLIGFLLLLRLTKDRGHCGDRLVKVIESFGRSSLE